MTAEKQEKQTAASLMRQLGAELEDFRDSPEQIASFLRWNNTFHDYSITNRFYIFLQMPTATQVASYKKWESLDRQVVKGSKSITIFAPNKFVKKPKPGEAEEDAKEETVVAFRKVPVFDISQTEGEPIDLLPKIHNTEALAQLASEITETLESLNVRIERFVSSPESLSGYQPHERLVSINSVHPKSVQDVSVIRAMALYHLRENLKTVFNEPLNAHEESWIANAATWALLERRGVNATEYTATLLHTYNGERKLKELLITTDKVVTFLDALDEGIPAEWATAVIQDTDSSVA